MLDVALENLLDESGDSVYKLVILVSKRALEIAEGQPKLIEADSSIKPSTVAMQEIAAGKLHYKQIRPQ
ncbi:MAG: DNA-directed RNA polymerase subunit omega [Candidatus Omnitrophota bacterium]